MVFGTSNIEHTMRSSYTRFGYIRNIEFGLECWSTTHEISKPIPERDLLDFWFKDNNATRYCSIAEIIVQINNCNVIDPMVIRLIETRILIQSILAPTRVPFFIREIFLVT